MENVRTKLLPEVSASRSAVASGVNANDTRCVPGLIPVAGPTGEPVACLGRRVGRLFECPRKERSVEIVQVHIVCRYPEKGITVARFLWRRRCVEAVVVLITRSVLPAQRRVWLFCALPSQAWKTVTTMLKKIRPFETACLVFGVPERKVRQDDPSVWSGATLAVGFVLRYLAPIRTICIYCGVQASSLCITLRLNLRHCLADSVYPPRCCQNVRQTFIPPHHSAGAVGGCPTCVVPGWWVWPGPGRAGSDHNLHMRLRVVSDLSAHFILCGGVPFRSSLKDFSLECFHIDHHKRQISYSKPDSRNALVNLIYSCSAVWEVIQHNIGTS